MKSRQNILTLCGAAIGGVLGYYAFFWVASQGFYGLILPGGLLGLGASVGKSRSITISVLCGCLGLTLGLFAEWRFAPFVADRSLGYFLSHLHQLKPITILMIMAGAFISFWAPFRRAQDARRTVVC